MAAVPPGGILLCPCERGHSAYRDEEGRERRMRCNNSTSSRSTRRGLRDRGEAGFDAQLHGMTFVPWKTSVAFPLGTLSEGAQMSAPESWRRPALAPALHN